MWDAQKDEHKLLVEVKENQGIMFLMACQGIERTRERKKVKTEINKNVKIMNTPPLS